MRLYRLASLAILVTGIAALVLPSPASADSAEFDRFLEFRRDHRQPRRTPPAAPYCPARRARQAGSLESALVAVHKQLVAQQPKVADAPPASPGVLLNSRGYNYGAAPGLGQQVHQAEIDAARR
jgi:hypothetical protein